MVRTAFYTSPPCYSETRAAEYVQWALTRATWRAWGGLRIHRHDAGMAFCVEMTECGRIVAHQTYPAFVPAHAVLLDGDTFHETTPVDIVERLLTLTAARIRKAAK